MNLFELFCWKKNLKRCFIQKNEPGALLAQPISPSLSPSRKHGPASPPSEPVRARALFFSFQSLTCGVHTSAPTDRVSVTPPSPSSVQEIRLAGDCSSLLIPAIMPTISFRSNTYITPPSPSSFSPTRPHRFCHQAAGIARRRRLFRHRLLTNPVSSVDPCFPLLFHTSSITRAHLRDTFSARFVQQSSRSTDLAGEHRSELDAPP